MFEKMGQKSQNMPFFDKLGHLAQKWCILNFWALFLKDLTKVL